MEQQEDGEAALAGAIQSGMPTWLANTGGARMRAAVRRKAAGNMTADMEVTEPRTTIDRALEAWEQNGPTSLTVALVTDALYGARDRLAAVEALHHPSTDHGEGMKPYCVGCWEACGEEGAPLWPCPTIRAAVAADPADTTR